MVERALGYATIMEDLVTAILLAVGLEAVFFALLLVMGRLESKGLQSHVRVRTPPIVPPKATPHAPVEDEPPWAA
jgi:hypothetical protein